MIAEMRSSASPLTFPTTSLPQKVVRIELL